MDRYERLLAVAEAAYQFEKRHPDTYDETFPQKPVSDYNQHPLQVSASAEQVTEFMHLVDEQLALVPDPLDDIQNALHDMLTHVDVESKSLEFKTRHVRNAAYWHAPVGTPLPLHRPATMKIRRTRKQNLDYLQNDLGIQMVHHNHMSDDTIAAVASCVEQMERKYPGFSKYVPAFILDYNATAVGAHTTYMDKIRRNARSHTQMGYPIETREDAIYARDAWKVAHEQRHDHYVVGLSAGFFAEGSGGMFDEVLPGLLESNYSCRAYAATPKDERTRQLALETIVMHELGHAVSYMALLEMPETDLPHQNRIASKSYEEVMGVFDDKNFTIRERGRVYMNTDVISREVTEYATVNGRELLAEVWSEYMLSPKSRPTIKAIGDIMATGMDKIMEGQS